MLNFCLARRRVAAQLDPSLHPGQYPPWPSCRVQDHPGTVHIAAAEHPADQRVGGRDPVHHPVECHLAAAGRVASRVWQPEGLVHALMGLKVGPQRNWGVPWAAVEGVAHPWVVLGVVCQLAC